MDKNCGHNKKKAVPYRLKGVFWCWKWPRPGMSIERVLETLEIRMSPFALCELRGDCRVDFGVRPFAILHYVLDGSATVNIGNNVDVQLSPGTVLLAPAYLTYAFHVTNAGGSTRPRNLPPIEGMTNVVVGDKSVGSPLFAICGRLEIAYRGSGGALSLLRYPIVEHLSPTDRVRMALDQFVYEVSHPDIGTRALAESLLEQCVIRLFRRRHNAGDPSLWWIDGATDEKLWPAMEAMLENPEFGHNLESLAERCALSRSVFASRFGKAYKIGPIEVLRNIRLRRAADLLTRSDLPIKRISAMAGYQSRTYFSRAFKEEFGVSPSDFKKIAAD